MRTLAKISLVIAIVLAPSLARADEDLDVRAEPPPKLAPGSVKIFDTRQSTYSIFAAGGPLAYRSVHDASFQSGVFEARIGRAITTAKYPFFLAGYRSIDVRMFDDKSYALSILHEIGAAVALGPLEPEVRVGFDLVTLDVFRGSYNASLFSPRVSAGGALKVNKFRLDFQAYSAYLWRWFGASYLVRGVMIGASFDTPRVHRNAFGNDENEGSGSLSLGSE